MIPSILHTTDLFHPHGDPDDHFDLALQFALYASGNTVLRQVVIDHPTRTVMQDEFSPAVAAVAQMNEITGKNVPFRVGCSQGVRSRFDSLEDLSEIQRGGVNAILDTLQKSDSPVRIVAVGDCSDIAAAFRTAPELFREKCQRVYINAGTGRITEGREREWNVVLNRAAYAALFDLPCPIYWCPCFHIIHDEPEYFGPCNEGENGSVFFADQAPLFDRMTLRVRNFFSYMFERSNDLMWLAWLDRKESSPALEEERGQKRRFYSTASIFHAANLAVDLDGNVVDWSKAKNSVYTFEPVQVSCDDTGVTKWNYASSDTGRYILKISSPRYASAMAEAMGRELASLGTSTAKGERK